MPSVPSGGYRPAGRCGKNVPSAKGRGMRAHAAHRLRRISKRAMPRVDTSGASAARGHHRIGPAAGRVMRRDAREQRCAGERTAPTPAKRGPAAWLRHGHGNLGGQQVPGPGKLVLSRSAGPERTAGLRYRRGLHCRGTSTRCKARWAPRSPTRIARCRAPATRRTTCSSGWASISPAESSAIAQMGGRATRRRDRARVYSATNSAPPGVEASMPRSLLHLEPKIQLIKKELT